MTRFSKPKSVEVAVTYFRCDACGVEAQTQPTGFQIEPDDTYASTGLNYPATTDQGNWDEARVGKHYAHCCDACPIEEAMLAVLRREGWAPKE